MIALGLGMKQRPQRSRLPPQRSRLPYALEDLKRQGYEQVGTMRMEDFRPGDMVRVFSGPQETRDGVFERICCSKQKCSKVIVSIDGHSWKLDSRNLVKTVTGGGDTSWYALKTGNIAVYAKNEAYPKNYVSGKMVVGSRVKIESSRECTGFNYSKLVGQFGTIVGNANSDRGEMFILRLDNGVVTDKKYGISEMDLGLVSSATESTPSMGNSMGCGTSHRMRGSQGSMRGGIPMRRDPYARRRGEPVASLGINDPSRFPPKPIPHILLGGCRYHCGLSGCINGSKCRGGRS